MKIRPFRGAESAASQQNKNGEGERSQGGSRSWTSRSTDSRIFGRLHCLASAQKDFPAGTKLEHFAPAAVRFARIATTAPVPDEPMTPVCPIFAWDEFHQ